MTDIFYKDKDARLVYGFDWSQWLADGESITSCSVVGDSGINVESFVNTSSSVIYWLSGGCLLKTYDITCSILTSASQLDDRTVHINIVQK